MATNTILTPDMITKEALRVLHEMLSFVTGINKQYDSSFAKKGAKIGDTLRIELPAQFKIRRGINMDSPVQDYIQAATNLVVEDIVGVDAEFGEIDLTMDLDDFSAKFIKPAISRIAAEIETDCLESAVGQSVVSASSASELYRSFLIAQSYLDNMTAPRDARTVLIDTAMQVDIIDDLKGLFQSAENIKEQYREGKMGRTAGADWVQSTYIPVTTESPEASFAIVSFSAGNPAVGTNAGASMVITATGAGTIPKGTIFELNNNATAANGTAWALQPETKKQFVGQKIYVTAEADVVIAGAGAVTVPIAAQIISDSTSARQNISAAPTFAHAVAENLIRSIVYHKEFMTFASADMTLPNGVDMASRMNFEGISIAMVRDFNIADRSYPVRFDVLYGKKVIRPEFGATVLKDY